MPPIQDDSTPGPSRLQLIYSVPTFMEAAEQANLDRIREHLQILLVLLLQHSPGGGAPTS